MTGLLADIRFADLLPDSISKDPSIEAAASAIGDELQHLNAQLRNVLIYERLDELEGDVLNLLAWQFSVDFFDIRMPDRNKRKLIRNSIAWHKKKGTAWAVKQVLSASGFRDVEVVSHSTLIEKWVEAGGGFINGDGVLDGDGTLSADAGKFKFMTSHWAEFCIRINAADEVLDGASQVAAVNMINVVKPARSHLAGLEFYALYQLLSEISLGSWSVKVKSRYDQCGAAQVPGFGIIGWGCEQIGGGWEPATLNGKGNLDGWGLIDGIDPVGELLDDGHWGTMRAKLTMPRYTQAFGSDGPQPGNLDPDHRAVPDYLDGRGDLSVATLDGSGSLDGKTDLSIEPLVRRTYEMLDGTDTLGGQPGTPAIRHTGHITWWNGNKHYREAI